MEIKKPKDAGEAFVIKQQSIKQRGSAIDIGMSTGNALTNATNLVICLINQAPAMALDEKAIELKIKEWTDKIYKIGQDKKDFESIPIIEEEPKSSYPEKRDNLKPQLDEMAEAKKQQLKEEGVKFYGEHDILDNV